jgi:predicted ArsR family transcriptional regulator
VSLKAFDEQVKGIAALDNAISRNTYRLVIDQSWVSRDEVADALNVARSVAAFHLEKLVDSGLLKVRYERRTGRTGPGAGRPTKLYGRSEREFDLSLPPRRYDLAGALLADAVTLAEENGTPISKAVTLVSREAGELVGTNCEDGIDLVSVLERHGYEPRVQDRMIKLLNCPFDALAQQHRDLVCGMNLDFLNGIVAGMSTSTAFAPRLAPEPGYCCVRFDAL